LNQAHFVFVYDASGQLVAEYAATIASVEEAQESYLTTDHLGSPRTCSSNSAQHGITTVQGWIQKGCVKW